jgi:hypothetical protein
MFLQTIDLTTFFFNRLEQPLNNVSIGYSQAKGNLTTKHIVELYFFSTCQNGNRYYFFVHYSIKMHSLSFKCFVINHFKHISLRDYIPTHLNSNRAVFFTNACRMAWKFAKLLSKKFILDLNHELSRYIRYTTIIL